MIENQNQFKITREQAERLVRALEELENGPCPPDVDPVLHEAEIVGIKSILFDLFVDMLSYIVRTAGKKIP